jgi:hypothetical protein
MTVALRVFASFTAAGQRGVYTPLPHIHPLVTALHYKKEEALSSFYPFCLPPHAYNLIDESRRDGI